MATIRLVTGLCANFARHSYEKQRREEEGADYEAGITTTRTIKGRRRLDVDNKPKRWNTPIQGSAANTLKAIAVEAYERLSEVPGAEIVGLVHDEVLLLVPEEHAERAENWLTDNMETLGDGVVNGNLPPDKRVPIKADTRVCDSWGDKE